VQNFVAHKRRATRGVHTPMTIERVRKELTPKELRCARGAKECVSDGKYRGWMLDVGG
jgi:hypothetical protein